MTDRLGEMLEQQMDELSDAFGRELESDDFLFPGAHHEHLEHKMVEGMKAAGIDPALIYAFEQTGILVSEDNQDLFSEENLNKWRAAIDDYREQHDDSAARYPVGTVARYGPNDEVTTKIVAGVLLSPDSEPILERFVGSDIADDEKVDAKIEAFFEHHNVQEVIAAEANLGCPHEEGEDFPVGEDCPFCPFWEGKQGSAALETEDDELSPHERELAMEFLQGLDPSLLEQLTQLAEQSEDAEEFAQMLMVGECPSCESTNAHDLGDDPEIDDPSVARCEDCGQIWCCFCGEIFFSAEEVAAHDCSVMEGLDNELDSPF